MGFGFGELVTFGAVSLRGIFTDTSVEGGELGGPRVLLPSADVDTHAIVKGDTLTIRGRTFEVAGVQPDGTGVTNLVLHEPL